jgi:hypothetical protein
MIVIQKVDHLSPAMFRSDEQLSRDLTDHHLQLTHGRALGVANLLNRFDLDLKCCAIITTALR